ELLSVFTSDQTAPPTAELAAVPESVGHAGRQRETDKSTKRLPALSSLPGSASVRLSLILLYTQLVQRGLRAWPRPSCPSDSRLGPVPVGQSDQVCPSDENGVGSPVRDKCSRRRVGCRTRAWSDTPAPLPGLHAPRPAART